MFSKPKVMGYCNRNSLFEKPNTILSCHVGHSSGHGYMTYTMKLNYLHVILYAYYYVFILRTYAFSSWMKDFGYSTSYIHTDFQQIALHISLLLCLVFTHINAYICYSYIIPHSVVCMWRNSWAGSMLRSGPSHLTSPTRRLARPYQCSLCSARV